MKIFKKMKKAFTLVELVTVIAVIAVLAAVSVGAYFGITETANRSAAFQNVKQMNDMLVMGKISDGRPNNTFHEARRDIQKQGLDPVTLKEFGTYKYGWVPAADNKDVDKFVIVNTVKKDGKYEIVAPYEEETADVGNIFIITKSLDGLSRDFSYYLDDDCVVSQEEITVYNGIDTGLVTGIKSITYNGSDNIASNIIINTGSFETTLTINGDNKDHVEHYGYSSYVKVNRVSNNSYVEHGTVGCIEISEGKLELSSQSEVFTTKITSGVEFINNSSYHNPKDISEGILDCSMGHEKEHTKVIADLSYVYRICTLCGRTTSYNGKEVDVDGEITKIGELEYALDLVNYKLSCNHDSFRYAPPKDGAPEGSYGSDTCVSCLWTFKTYFNNHVYKAETPFNEETGEYGNTRYYCECGCYDSAFPIASVSELPDGYETQEGNVFADEYFEEGGVPQKGCKVSIINTLADSAGAVLGGNPDYFIKDYSAGYLFQTVEDRENEELQTIQIQQSSKGLWLADFVISFDKEIEPNSIGLWGSRGSLTFGFEFGYKIEAKTSFPLLISAFLSAGFKEHIGMLTYQFIASEVRDFYCGTFAVADKENNSLYGTDSIDGVPAKITVELAMFDIEGILSSEYITDENNPDLSFIATEEFRNSGLFHSVNLKDYYFDKQVTKHFVD